MIDMDIQQQIEQLYATQLAEWKECGQRYADLASSRVRTIYINERDYRLVFNPARKRSAAAVIDNGKVDRPCFLCRKARPAEQQDIKLVTPFGHTYDISVNPYPITEHHLTIIAREHTPQSFKGRHWDMAYVADLLPDYLIFFNGACSGASAPDHMHFQAVPKSLVPLTSWDVETRLAMGVTNTIPVINDSDQKNVICWTEGSEAWWLVIDRKAHRPWQYSAAGEEQVLISPAALEFCGVVPLCREEDFEKMTPELLQDLLGQCEYCEPLIHVGVMEGQQIRFSAEEREHSLNYLGEDRILDVMDYGSNRAEKVEIDEYWNHCAPFTLEDVTIGKGFHWQKQEDQIFRGSLHVIAREGQLHAINIIPVEEYLKSVISSEMSATNNLELLKTHAIISRSWVLRQISNGRKTQLSKQACVVSNNTAATCAETSQSATTRTETSLGKNELRVMQYWDHDDHTLYDVCADDHCQRYQGITREVSPLVAQAIEETRGMVLMSEGEICDARFSKCCGGRSELFSTCWQDQDYPYLQPVDDPWCDPKNMGETAEERHRVLSLVLNDYDQSTLNFHDWEVRYTQQELTDLIERKLHLGLGTILSLEPLQRGVSGRICLLRVVGSEKTVELGKELLIRKALSETHLLSSWFDVRWDESSSTFILNGKGWGHGVGLCQIGAANMSQHGKTHQDILSHYFSGVTIERLY